jgi:hypothetical protein
MYQIDAGQLVQKGMELGFALEFLELIQVLQVSEETNLEPLMLH